MEYYRLKSYHPKKTFSGQETRVPHICYSKYWKTSPHIGYRCNDCIEVEKIIKYEDYLELTYQNRQHTLYNCDCHWCKNRNQKSHDDCITCNPTEDKFIISIEEDEDKNPDESDNKLIVSRKMIRKRKMRCFNDKEQKREDIRKADKKFKTPSFNNEIPFWKQMKKDLEILEKQQQQILTELDIHLHKYWTKEPVNYQTKEDIKTNSLPLTLFTDDWLLKILIS